MKWNKPMKILTDWRFLSSGLALYFALLFLLYQNPQSTISPEEILQREPDHTVAEEALELTPVAMQRESIQEIMDNLPRREQTRQGITVRVDKIVFERIYNVPEFLESEILADRGEDSRDDVIRLVRETKGVIRVLVSIKGTCGNKQLLVDYPEFTSNWTSHKFTSGRSCWQKDVPDFNIGPTTMIEHYQLVNEGDQISDIFPLSLTVRLTATTDEDPIEFKFVGLRL
jgi:hypothetical protein